MGWMSWLSMALKGGTRSFNEFEHRVLSGVVSALPSDMRQRLEQRIQAVNLVQRLDGGREINCFVMRGGKAVLDESTRIDDAAGEKLLANVVVEGMPGTANTGKVWLVEGNFFSLEFDDPTEHADSAAVEGIRVQLLGLTHRPD